MSNKLFSWKEVLAKKKGNVERQILQELRIAWFWYVKMQTPECPSCKARYYSASRKALDKAVSYLEKLEPQAREEFKYRYPVAGKLLFSDIGDWGDFAPKEVTQFFKSIP